MTELIWEGKYKDGKKVAPVRIALPFQTIETVNESVQDRQRTLDMFAQGKPTEWRNRLIWGDKKYVLPSLLPEFAGKVNLIYIDPPFDTGADFSFTATIPDNPETEDDETTTFVKEPSILEQKAYRDTWGKGLDSYMQWFYETVVMLRELLAEDGSMYVHLDWHVCHYAKTILDEVFGYENFQREVIWYFDNVSGFKSIAPNWIRDHESIFWYTKSSSYVFNKTYGEYPEGYENKFSNIEEGTGRRFMKRAGRKQYLDELKGKPLGDVWRIPFINNMSLERVGYATQKPEALLERIIKASSSEGDLVLDCFVGSGTTAAVAEKLNRRWITCDLGKFAIHTTRKRLLQIPNVNPFVVQNLGKYERQAWQVSEFPNSDDRATQEKSYRNFILSLYNAEPVKGFVWLHGTRERRMVHVGAVDAPVALGDVKGIIQEFWKSVGKSSDITTNGADILGWEFAFDINETAKQQAAASRVDVKFKKIPREVLDKRAVDQGDVHFFELAALDARTKTKGKQVELTLKDFVIPPDDVPEEIRTKVTHWSQWIDYWAVDWNYRDDTFHNEWQTYRAKKNPKIDLSTTHTYEEKGTYTIVVKVIDILGNDTTKAIKVDVK